MLIQYNQYVLSACSFLDSELRDSYIKISDTGPAFEELNARDPVSQII